MSVELSLVALNTCTGLRAFQKKYPDLEYIIKFIWSRKVLGRLASPHMKSRMWERRKVFLSEPSNPSAADFEWWLIWLVPFPAQSHLLKLKCFR